MEEGNMVGAKRSYPGGRPQKWILDERGRRMIMDLYDGTSERITLIQKELQVPRKVVKHWAGKIGVTRVTKIEWTVHEISYLERYYGKKSLHDIAKDLKKSYDSTRKKAFFLGLRGGLKNLDHYTGTDLKEAFGCKYERIQMWIKKGWIRGFEQGGAMQFTDKNIRDFIVTHPTEIDQRRVDWLWVVDILAGDRGLGRLGEDKYTDRTR
jgi:hypothetical protein